MGASESKRRQSVDFGYPYAQYQYDPIAVNRVEYVVPRYEIKQDNYEFWNTVKRPVPPPVVLQQPILSVAPVASYVSAPYAVGSLPVTSSQPSLYQSSNYLDPSLYRSSTNLNPQVLVGAPTYTSSYAPSSQPYLGSPRVGSAQYLPQPNLVPAPLPISRSYSPSPIVQRPSFRAQQENNLIPC